MGRSFLTVPEELLGIAERLAEYFRTAGYTVVVEDRSRPDYPYMPTLKCKRGPTTILLEVVGAIPSRERLREWRAYCSSRSRDTRFAFGVPLSEHLTATQLANLEADGIGLFAVSDEYRVQEMLNPHDLPLNLQPPALDAYPRRVRSVLGPAWDELQRGNWREGFDAACVALESEVRRYLLRHIKSGRLAFQTPKGRPKTFGNQDIQRMPMGRLKDSLEMIVKPNHADSMLLRILESLNPDRILVAHKRQESRAETRMRKKVPGHLWSIVRAVEHAVT